MTDEWFTAQVRGRSPEPPPDGFLVPPGFADDLMAALRQSLFPAWLDSGEPLPPPSWRTRLRWKRDAWREALARRAYRLLAGYWPRDEWDE